MAEHTTTTPLAPWVELRVLRTKDGHSLTSLAKAAGLSLSYLSDLERGRRKPNSRVLKALARAMNVPVSVLEPGTTAHPTGRTAGDAA